MKKVLFVDDEPSITDGLRRMLRPMRKEWDMSFANSGKEALEILAKDTFDVIVSDMRMPVMDGAALLHEVMTQHPKVVRIVLTGQSSNEENVRIAGIAHQFLSKPCGADKLRQAIDRAFNLRGILGNVSLQRIISQAKTLPSMPALFQEINQELQHPDASTRRIGTIISKDPGMTAKVLQLVNSSFFGIARSVTNPEDAATLLGTETLRSLVLSIGIFDEFKAIKGSMLDVQGLWNHCVNTGALARGISCSEKAPKAAADMAMLAGLLHDAGKLILAQNFPESYSNVLAGIRDLDARPCEVEREAIGATHAEVAAYLFGLWALPDPIIEAVAFHHCPTMAMDRNFQPLTAVHVANVIEHEIQDADTPSNGSSLDLDYLTHLHLVDRLPVWRECCQKLLNKEVLA